MHAGAFAVHETPRTLRHAFLMLQYLIEIAMVTFQPLLVSLSQGRHCPFHAGKNAKKERLAVGPSACSVIPRLDHEEDQ